MPANSSDLPAALAFSGGEVHNRVDPFATAIIVEDGQIAWLGSDEAVSVVGGRTPVGLDGQLVAPPFADAWVEHGPEDPTPALLARGVRAALMIHDSRADALHAEEASSGPLLIRRAARVTAASLIADGPAPDAILPVLPADDRPSEALAWAAEHGARLVLEADDASRSAALRSAAETRRDAGRRLPGAGHLVRIHDGSEDRARGLADLGFSLVATQDSRPDAVRLAVAAGAPIALGWPAETDPWEALRRVVVSGGASTRSALRGGDPGRLARPRPLGASRGDRPRGARGPGVLVDRRSRGARRRLPAVGLEHGSPLGDARSARSGSRGGAATAAEACSSTG